MIEQAAFATSVNEAWAMLAAMALLGLLIIPLRARRSGTPPAADRISPA